MMNAKILRRYTSLPVLLNILNNKKLTLLDPQSWEDKNDSYYLNLYKNKMGFKSVLALCFTEALETYHHWKVFSGNSSGVCIHFDKNKFLSKLNGVAEIRSGYVIYKKLDKVKIKLRPIDKLPFLKRYAFRDEIEFRLIYQSKSKEVNKKGSSGK